MTSVPQFDVISFVQAAAAADGTKNLFQDTTVAEVTAAFEYMIQRYTLGGSFDNIYNATVSHFEKPTSPPSMLVAISAARHFFSEFLVGLKGTKTFEAVPLFLTLKYDYYTMTENLERMYVNGFRLTWIQRPQEPREIQNRLTEIARASGYVLSRNTIDSGVSFELGGAAGLLDEEGMKNLAMSIFDNQGYDITFVDVFANGQEMYAAKTQVG